jgi:hypothetical protein
MAADAAPDVQSFRPNALTERDAKAADPHPLLFPAFNPKHPENCRFQDDSRPGRGLAGRRVTGTAKHKKRRSIPCNRNFSAKSVFTDRLALLSRNDNVPCTFRFGRACHGSSAVLGRVQAPLLAFVPDVDVFPFERLGQMRLRNR